MRRARRWQVGLLAAALALTTAACQTARGGDVGDGPSTPDDAGGPGGAGSGEYGLVLQVQHAGGFVPMGYDFRTVPALTVYGDGQAIVPGPVPEIYPGPALPNLQQVPPDAAGEEPSARVAALVEAAEDAGLLATPPDYGMPNITDLPTTRVTLTVGDRVYEHAAYALGMEGAGVGDDADDVGAYDDGLTDEQREARGRLSSFVQRAYELVGVTGGEESYVPQAFAYFAYPAGEWGGDPALEPVVVPWPLEASLAGASSCAVADGEAGAALRAALAAASELTRFEQDGTAYEVFVRPLLPHETTCADLGIEG